MHVLLYIECILLLLSLVLLLLLLSLKKLLSLLLLSLLLLLLLLSLLLWEKIAEIALKPGVKFSNSILLLKIIEKPSKGQPC